MKLNAYPDGRGDFLTPDEIHSEGAPHLETFADDFGDRMASAGL